MGLLPSNYPPASPASLLTFLPRPFFLGMATWHHVDNRTRWDWTETLRTQTGDTSALFSQITPTFVAVMEPFEII